ncbi:zinc finger protein 431 [Monomorium pharaonis]|uniref:zinc finger protein 431 n=1 Tax=Monomorium pharaonis TaxID=307658 RepID=UPI00063EE4F0|nr:zinc finger protein 431 [Monomorium pharaonis]XP_012530806.1 zinc finger protein 431 [Monomorium pharaonis]XP_012530808.1 zinc finger protein 431 [Monomorium pharaonis]XP_028049192.1 zinc finger protein 431 [Monomorium pharaonis]XP_036148225.1 zinc finger protein 431 [Monomorium pharaonis]XP_036148226.1 zinc finger protein 431 [Monomorium pharaonis]
MMADSDKDSIQCLVCDSKVGVSTRNSIRIFDDSSYTVSEKPLVDVISAVLEVDISEESVHSLIVCKKCFKLFNEVDELENKLSQIKMELCNNYKKTIEVKKLRDILQNEEDCNDHDYTDNTESQSTLITEVQEEKDYVQEETQKEEEQESLIETEESSLFTVEEVDETTNSSDDKKKSKKSKVKQEIIPLESIVIRDESSYICLLCSNENEEGFTADARCIIAHMKDVHDTRLYICDVCGQDFRKRNEMSLHLDDHVAKEEGDFQCEICNRIFNNLRLFRIHKRIHYPQVKSWPCDTCGKRYNSKNLLEEHTNTHIGVRPYVCETCGKDFASKYTYKAHAKTHEVRPRPFECTRCNKTFLNQQNLSQHERTHNGIKDYICHQCGKAFTSSHNLEVHNIVHTGYKPYICRICSKAFARKAEIRDHERTHTGEKPYQCEFCGATFSQRSNLQSHKRATHYNDKRYKCDECGKGFKRRRLLDYHIKAAHTGERPFKCDVCSATFVYPEHFKKHRRIHTGEKPYLCEVCGKAFNSRDNRNAHRFIHSDKKPYECLVCGMGFMRKPLLYAHMQVQGHLNDTIVVNQPRLTTETDVITIPNSNSEILMEEVENEQMDETEVYVTELKNHVIIQQEGDDQIYNEEDVVLNIPAEETVTNEVDLVVEDQMNFMEDEATEEDKNVINQVETVYAYNESEEGETIVIPSASQGEDKNMRLVQIRFPTSVDGESKNWLSLVQNT